MVIQFPGPRGPRIPTGPPHTDDNTPLTSFDLEGCSATGAALREARGQVPDHLERQWLDDFPPQSILGVPISGAELATLQDVLGDFIEQLPIDIELPGIVQLALRLHALTGEDLPPRLRRL